MHFKVVGFFMELTNFYDSDNLEILGARGLVVS